MKWRARFYFIKPWKKFFSNLFSTWEKCVSLNCGNFCRTTHIVFKLCITHEQVWRTCWWYIVFKLCNTHEQVWRTYWWYIVFKVCITHVQVWTIWAFQFQYLQSHFLYRSRGNWCETSTKLLRIFVCLLIPSILIISGRTKNHPIKHQIFYKMSIESPKRN